MSQTSLTPADRPTFYFIGMTTATSSIMRVFPEWARHLELGDCPIRGIDCRWHDDPEVYREVVSFIKHDPLSLGGLVTTHKIDLLAAARDLFDELGPHAELLGEISCISKQNGKLVGHAKDPVTSGLALEAFLPKGYWQETGADLCLLGAGGSSLALTTYLMTSEAPAEPPRGRCGVDRPARIFVNNRSTPRLEEMKKIHTDMNPGIEVVYTHTPEAADNDRIVNALKPGSLVVNATGLGKDAPGSPLTDAAVFPRDGIAWEFNYRGDLLFLRQAEAQKAERHLVVEDGWVYFLHGWTRVIAEVFHREIPVAGPEFEKLSDIASKARKPSW